MDVLRWFILSIIACIAVYISVTTSEYEIPYFILCIYVIINSVSELIQSK